MTSRKKQSRSNGQIQNLINIDLIKNLHRFTFVERRQKAQFGSPFSLSHPIAVDDYSGDLSGFYNITLVLINSG